MPRDAAAQTPIAAGGSPVRPAYVIEVELLPASLQVSEPDGAKRATETEPAGPPRGLAGPVGGDARPALTDERGGASGFATREEADAVALELRRWFTAETIRVVAAPEGG